MGFNVYIYKAIMREERIESLMNFINKFVFYTYLV